MRGGGVLNAGSLTLTRAAVRDNALHTGEPTLYGGIDNHSEGGGVWSSGTLALVDEVTGNVTRRPRGRHLPEPELLHVPRRAGARRRSVASGPVTITRSTVSGNTARGGAGRAANPEQLPATTCSRAAGPRWAAACG